MRQPRDCSDQTTPLFDLVHNISFEEGHPKHGVVVKGVCPGQTKARGCVIGEKN